MSTNLNSLVTAVLDASPNPVEFGPEPATWWALLLGGSRPVCTFGERVARCEFTSTWWWGTDKDHTMLFGERCTRIASQQPSGEWLCATHQLYDRKFGL